MPRVRVGDGEKFPRNRVMAEEKFCQSGPDRAGVSGRLATPQAAPATADRVILNQTYTYLSPSFPYPSPRTTQNSFERQEGKTMRNRKLETCPAGYGCAARGCGHCHINRFDGCQEIRRRKHAGRYRRGRIADQDSDQAPRGRLQTRTARSIIISPPIRRRRMWKANRRSRPPATHRPTSTICRRLPACSATIRT